MLGNTGIPGKVLHHHGEQSIANPILSKAMLLVRHDAPLVKMFGYISNQFMFQGLTENANEGRRAEVIWYGFVLCS